MPLEGTDLFVIQRQTGGSPLLKATATQLNSYVSKTLNEVTLQGNNSNQDITLGTDNITLDASDGSITAAGDVTFGTSSNCRLQYVVNSGNNSVLNIRATGSTNNAATALNIFNSSGASTVSALYDGSITAAGRVDAGSATLDNAAIVASANHATKGVIQAYHYNNGSIFLGGGSDGVTKAEIKADGSITAAGEGSFKTITNNDQFFNDKSEIIDIKANGMGGGATGDLIGIKADLTASNASSKLYGFYIDSKAGTGQSAWGGFASAKVNQSGQSAVGLYGEALVQAGAGQNLGSTAGVKGVGRNFTGPGNASKVIGVMAENLCDSGNTAWGFYGSTQTGAATVTPLELFHDDTSILNVDSSGGATFAGALEAESIDGGTY